MAGYFENGPGDLVPDALSGFARAHADLVAHDPVDGFFTARHSSAARRVGLLSGGGSGHEPLHAGYVGAGMLDAACPGRVFASPHNRQIFRASGAVAGPEGVLHIVKNYTGDRINFGIAAERLADAGIACARVLVDDDLASDSEGVAAGRRGTGATMLVEKVLGGAADTGMGLDALAELGTAVTSRCRTLAAASAAHHAPATGEPAFGLLPGELEYGVGIHGERADRTRSQGRVGALVEDMAGALLDALRPGPDDPVVALVNGLGSVTSLELYGIFGELGRVLDARRVRLARHLVGNYVTALDMRGFSLTLMVADGDTLDFYDAPVRTPALSW
ncbi:MULTISPECIES: dihydroxyacetone kinase subunit DhaK [Streptomyces]|uniref:Dihydroxyacetone kinase-like protein n=1 Tax=Streptomyces clavifer TaxID=68188 RepID=A0ABS4V1A4_9ACTN|nr:MULTISPECIES: dihydroxyacetone kinase subunit DhaK [Streptomyces]MBP2357690.1 dihydroxyacetone kinase-like protein [Streptomyces clavifer]MDX2747700.1 dihydroxyacetone kinase subunit DhaK [Streptomyces sp. NRRL_B-2557]RPK84598.1 PTS-dependent dihydroxyacetone kinase, dihydroxyacetone-binding subunit DhaK [Streptomyces sp. ADI97-07]GHB26568.1 dihydroxyacetone kinase subunit DhaK [Streptomyces clavifer]